MAAEKSAGRKVTPTMVAVTLSALVALSSAWWTIATHMVENVEDRLHAHALQPAHEGAHEQFVDIRKELASQSANTAALGEALEGVRDALRELRAELRAWRAERNR